MNQSGQGWLDLAPAPDHPTPLYLQLAHKLAAAIRRGRWAPGEALPSERTLSGLLSVSRVTVRRALETLVEQELLECRHGSGNFVVDRIQQPTSILTSFSDDMRARGRQPSSRLIERTYSSASPEEAVALNLPPGGPVFRLHRLRLGDGEPMAVETSALPADLIPDANAIGASLYAYLEGTGHLPVRALEYLRAENLAARESALLGVGQGTAGLFIRRTGFLDSNRPVEYSRSYYRGDRYDFVAELSRGRVTHGQVTQGQVTQGQVTQGQVTQGQVTRAPATEEHRS